MLYNDVLVSAIQQCESAIDIHMPPPSRTSLPPQPSAQPSRLSRVLVCTPCAIQHFPLATNFTYGNLYVSVLLNLSHPFPPRRVSQEVQL